MKNKKGFTLIELLAVIVILAIIALIAVPIILNMITSARKSAARSAALGYIDAIEYNNGFADVEQEGYTKITGTKNVSEINVKMKGKKPDSGSVTITNDGKVESATLCINGYNVKYTGKDAKVEGKCSSNGNNDTPSQTIYYYRDISDKKTTLDSSWINYIKETDKRIPAESNIYEYKMSNNGTMMYSSNYGHTYSTLEECQSYLSSNGFPTTAECLVYVEKGSLYNNKELEEVCINLPKYGGELCLTTGDYASNVDKIKKYFKWNDETNNSSYSDVMCEKFDNRFTCSDSSIYAMAEQIMANGVAVYDKNNKYKCSFYTPDSPKCFEAMY